MRRGVFAKLAHWFKRTKESIDDLEPIEATSQQAYDVESRSWIVPNYWGILPPFNLAPYLKLYLNDSLAHGIVETASLLTIADFEAYSADDALNDYVSEFNRRIELDLAVYSLIQDSNVYGFALAEIVGNGPTLTESDEILGLKRLDPRFIVVKKNERGRFEFFRQIPGLAIHAGLSMMNVKLDPQTVVFIHNPSPLTVYGKSLLQGMKRRLRQRDKLLRAAVRAAIKRANPPIHLSFKADPEAPETPDEARKRKRAEKRATREVDEGGGWLYTSGAGEYSATPIGFQSLPDLTALIEHITADCIVSAGLSPSAMGFSFGSGVTSHENSLSQQVNNIATKQNQIVAQLRRKLYRLLPLIEPECPAGEILVRMKPPTVETLQQKYEAVATLTNNVDRHLRMGMLSPDDAARQLGYQAVADEARLDEYLKSPMPEPNPKDPNKAQQIDAKTKSLNQGNAPSNNPSGQVKNKPLGEENY